MMYFSMQLLKFSGRWMQYVPRMALEKRAHRHMKVQGRCAPVGLTVYKISGMALGMINKI
jgi:hypothetical protein